MSTVSEHPELVWYASYGSNMHAERLACYLAGGTPLGARRCYPGCRDRRLPQRSTGCFLPGGIYFATKSPVWGGGRAFYDPALDGTAPARAYLITSAQFADIAAQEMYREPGTDLDIGQVLASGRIQLGPGWYETLLHVGEFEGHPLLTFTAPWRAQDVTWTVPSAPYLRMLAQGLRDAHGWDSDQVAGYLASLPGARGHWTPAQIAALVSQPP